MDPVTPIEMNALFDDAIRAARGWEGHLGKKKTGKAETAFMALKSGRLETGTPNLSIHALKKSDFEKENIYLGPEVEEHFQGKSGLAYYLVPLPVMLFPARGAQYRLLEADLDITPVEAGQDVAIQAIFPEPMWKPILAWGGVMRLGLDSRLTWGMEVKKTEAELAKLKGELALRVKNVNQMKSFIRLLSVEHTLGRMEIEAQYHPRRAMWRLDSKAAIRAQKQTLLVLLLKAPRDVRQVKLSVALQAEPSYDWLIMQVEHVFEHLPEAVRSAIKRRKGLPMQFFDSWTLDLAKE